MDPNQALLDAQRMATIGTLAGAIIGGLVGFLGSWLVTMVSTNAERRRQLLQLGYEMGMKQWEEEQKWAISQFENRGQVLLERPHRYVNFNVQVLEHIATGNLTPEALEKLASDNHIGSGPYGRGPKFPQTDKAKKTPDVPPQP